MLATWIDVLTSATGSLTAIGTLGAVGVALWLAGREARRQRSQESRRQAEFATAWIASETMDSAGHPQLIVVVGNASHQSLYQVIVSLVAIQGAWRRDGREYAGYRAFLWQAPPGETTAQISYEGHAMSLRFSVELAFRDAAGRSWRRRGDGMLEQLSTGPAAFYAVPEPIPWEDGTFVRVPRGRASDGN